MNLPFVESEDLGYVSGEQGEEEGSKLNEGGGRKAVMREGEGRDLLDWAAKPV
jgi:hypothetical protein